MKQRLLIIGAGGHARVVAETALLEEKYELVGFIDDYVAIGTVILRDYKVLAALQNIDRLEFDVFIVAVGKNSVRKNIYDFLKQKYEPALVIHPQSVISPFAHIAKGCVVLANAVISFGASVDENTIINSSSLVDHESAIGKHCHVAQGALIGSNCVLPELSELKLGERVFSYSQY